MNARGNRPVAVTIGLCLLFAAHLCADEVYVLPGEYTGSRSTATGGGVRGENAWDGISDNGFQITWTIVDLDPAPVRWSYTYTLSGVGGTDLSKGLSHWLLQLSKVYEDDDTDEEKRNKVLAEFPDFTEGQANETKDYSPSDPGNSNPFLQGDIFAVKFGATGDGESPQSYSFTSTRAAIWGNFHAVDGKKEGEETAAWNEGFLDDPADVLDGDYTNWIPTPDTLSDPPTVGPIADWGDLPDSYDTTFDKDGPRHIDGTHEWLGTFWDDETNGMPTTSAAGDDTEVLPDDEDGVEFVDGGVYVTVSVDDRLSGRYDEANLLYLDGWIDLDQDGTFDEPDDSDHVVPAWEVNPANIGEWGTTDDTATFFFPVPGWAPGFGPEGTGYYSRWRLNYGAPTSWKGEAPFGEVEDYWVVPEPMTIALFGLPLAILARYRRRRTK